MTNVTRSHRQRAFIAMRLSERLRPWVETGEDILYENTEHPNVMAREIAEASRSSVWTVSKVYYDGDGNNHEQLLTVCDSLAAAWRKAIKEQAFGVDLGWYHSDRPCHIWSGSPENRPNLAVYTYGLLIDEWCVLS